MGKLEGKVAVITGGSTGMALAGAKLFVEEGAHVFIQARRQEALDDAVKLIGRNVTAVQGDAAELDDLDRLPRVPPMTTFAQHRATVESFVDCMHGGADKDALARILAENVVLSARSAMSRSPAARPSRQPFRASPRWRRTSPTRRSSAVRPTMPHSSGCRSKTRRSTEWTTSSSTRTARSPR